MSVFPQRLHHTLPSWVQSGAVFHIRVRAAESTPCLLTDPTLADRLLESVRFYTERESWHHHLCLLMPDHIHMLLSFPPGSGMSATIRNWKRYHTKQNGVVWQTNYFDHRIRTAQEQNEKYEYILRNPVAKGLIPGIDNWPWVLQANEVNFRASRGSKEASYG